MILTRADPEHLARDTAEGAARRAEILALTEKFGNRSERGLFGTV